MRYALHGSAMMHTNIVSDFRVARSVGFHGIELSHPKVLRYLAAGFSLSDLAVQLGPLSLTMVNVLLGVESSNPQKRLALRKQCAQMADAAAALGAPSIQVVALDDFDSTEWGDQRDALVQSLAELGRIAVARGVKLALEPVIFSPFNSLSRALEVLDRLPVDAGLCLDTWHLWTAGTSWNAVAALDPARILAVQISDTAARAGVEWSDTDRRVLPGDGILPLQEAVQAIRATGYAGPWSVELHSGHHWEWDPDLLARTLLERLHRFLPPPGT